MEITSFLTKAHNYKSPEKDRIQNYCLKALQLPTGILQKTSVE